MKREWEKDFMTEETAHAAQSESSLSPILSSFELYLLPFFVCPFFFFCFWRSGGVTYFMTEETAHAAQSESSGWPFSRERKMSGR
jgi:hypothetical protein